MGNRQAGYYPPSALGNRQGGRGFTLIETLLSTVIVAVMFVAALNTLGASRVTQLKAALIGQGRMLAEALMAEILPQHYEEPDGACVFGREAGELETSRAAYDDVDDYQGWSESPPVTCEGTVLPDAAHWTRSVTVAWVDPLNPRQVSGAETGVKRITVVAAFREVPQATVVALKAAY
ncbi:MAG: prepilin-type N-terminal cleavage/methylation domain-containing protein [Planctomycetes bacterium]|jgi:prepilin-type N-terminal cleavage/methylation domain-containing protein|nr:prepilin-type N-terminal cleavage/methylation domain-containing protein [Planctomycetota bacterium]